MADQDHAKMNHQDEVDGDDEKSEPSGFGDVSNSTNGYLTASQSSINDTLKEELPPDPESRGDSHDEISEASDDATVHLNGNGYMTCSETSVDKTDDAKNILSKSSTVTSFPSLNGDYSSSAPGSPSPSTRDKPGSKRGTWKDKIRHLSGTGSNTNSTSIPQLDSPVTKDKFLFVYDYLKDMSEKSIEEYLKLSDLKCDDILEEKTGKTALHILCEDVKNASIKVFNALLNCNHNAKKQSSSCQNILHYAVYNSNNHIVEIVMKNFPELLSTQNNQGYNPIHIAVFAYNEEAIDIILKHSDKIPLQVSDDGLTPLHLILRIKELLIKNPPHDGLKALGNQHLLERIFKKLVVSSKISSDQLKSALMTPNQFPLHFLVKHRKFDLITEIVGKVKDPEVYETVDQEEATAFSMSLIEAKRCVLRTQSKLEDDEELASHANQGSEKKKKKTTQSKIESYKASDQLYLEIAYLLLENMENKFDDPIPKYYSMTPLQLVLNRVKSFQVERDLVALLLKKGADVRKSHEDLENPPIQVVGENWGTRRDILILFLDYFNRENVNKIDSNGSTVLHYAVNIKDEESITKLFDKEADPTIEGRISVKDIDNYLTYPNMQIESEFLLKTPLMISLAAQTSNIYFRALRKSLDKIIDIIPDSNLLFFFQTHLVAAAATMEKEMVRDLCMLLSHKSILRRMSNIMKENEVVREVIHYHSREHFEEKFHKTALAWANENDDPISVSDLLNLEHVTHNSKEEGLTCIKQQLTNDRLLYWITRTFSRFYPSNPCTVWTKAIIFSLLQLGLSYFLFIFDIYTDIQLTNDYYQAFNSIENHSRMMLTCARENVTELSNLSHSDSCFSVSDEYPEIAYKSAYYMTWASLSLSIIAYFVGINIIFNMDNITEKIFRKDKEAGKKSIAEKIMYGLKRIFFFILVRLMWPLLHIYRKIRYETIENKSSRRLKFIEFETIWIMVRTIEQGIEATLQLIIVLYLLVPYYDEIHNWNMQTTIQKIIKGVLHFLTLGNYTACLLEKVLGKLFLNVFFQSLSMAYLKFMKYGMAIQTHLFDMLPIFISYFLQIAGRLYALRALFVTAEELFGIADKGQAIAIFFAIHFIITLIIKIVLEPRKQNFTEANWNNAKFWIKFIINYFSSCLIYVQTNEFGTTPRCNIHEHNSFLPQTLFQLLILCEHLVITCFPLTLVTTDCLDIETYYNTVWIVFVGWVVSNLMMVWHYKGCHTWSAINGPSLKLKDDIQEEQMNNNVRQGTCTNIQDYFKNLNPELSCTTHLSWKKENQKLTLGKNCFKTERTKNTIYQTCDEFEMNQSRLPLMDNSISS